MVLTQSRLIMLSGSVKGGIKPASGVTGGPGQTYRELIEYDSLVCCLVCVDTSRAPKLLDCHHVFCEACLQMYYKECHNIHYEQQGIFIPCPTCRKLTKVPENGLCGLEEDTMRKSERLRKISHSSNHVQRCDVCTAKVKDAAAPEAGYYCSKCLMNLCDACHAAHSQQPLFRSHPVIHISNKETLSLACERHHRLPVKYFCLDCNVPACTVCILQDHSGHHAAELRDALAQRRDNLRTLLNALGPRLDKMEARLRKLSYITTATAKCRRHMERVSGSDGETEHRHRVSPRNSHQRTSSSESEHKPRVSTPENKLRLLPSDSERRRTNSDTDKRRTSDTENNHLRVSGSDLRVSSSESDTSSLGSLRRALGCHSALSAALDRLRRLYDLSTRILDMSQSKRLLVIYEDVVGRIQSVLDIEVKNLHSDVEAALASHHSDHHSTPPSSANSTHSSLEELSASTADLLGSSLLVKPKLLWRVEKQRSDVGELYNPCDVHFYPDGSLLVAEYDMVNDNNNRVRVCDQQGQTRAVLAQGTVRPLGLALTLDGNVVLTDCRDKRVKLFTPSGQLMADMGKGQFGWPYGIAVNSKGQIIVTDAFNDSISIFHPSDGKRIKTFGSSGAASTQFKNPYHVAVDAKDNILVSDSGNNCVKVFDVSGRFMFKTSEIKKKPSLEHGEVRKSRKKKLKAPRGICIDLKGNILVADDYSRVCMFDESGHFIRNLLTDEDGVKYPEAIACGSRGQIAVTEWNPNNMFSIKMFNMYE